MFILSADIDHDDTEVICCFDPTVVVVRFQRLFPEAEVIPQDFAWRDYDLFKQRGVVDGAVRVAENDARRRGPIWLFRLPLPNGTKARGKAERYEVRLSSDEPFPEPLKSSLLEFLEGLRFAPCVRVRSVRLEGNDEFPV